MLLSSHPATDGRVVLLAAPFQLQLPAVCDVLVSRLLRLAGTAFCVWWPELLLRW